MAQNFFFAIAGDARERRVAVHDMLLGIGDQDAFLSGIKHHGGLAQAVFILAPLSDVAGCADQALRLTVFVEQQTPARLNPAVAAVLVLQPVADLVGRCAERAHASLNIALKGNTVIGMQVLLPLQRINPEGLRANTQQGGIARRKVHKLLLQIPVPNPTSSGLQGLVQAFFTALQGAMPLLLVLLMATQDRIQQSRSQQNKPQPFEQLHALLLRH